MRWLADQIERALAEAKIWRSRRLPGRDKPRVLFFPSGQIEGAGLLRAKLIADALVPFGWCAATVPAVVNKAGRERIVRRFQPDLLVFQQCRHPLNDGELSFGIPYIVDTDDADFHLELPGLAERLERSVRGARGVIAGSRYVRDHHERHNSNVTVIWTGTPTNDEPWPRHSLRQAGHPPIMAWAQSRPLDYIRELEFVIDLEKRLQSSGSCHTLRFYGVDCAAERDALQSKLGVDSSAEFLPTLDYAKFLSSLNEVSVGLCPLLSDSEFSRGKSFGKILAYLHAGVPVVASNVADHELLFQPATGIVSNDVSVWDNAIRTLLGDPVARDSVAEGANDLLRRRLTIEVAAALTDKFLRRALLGHLVDQNSVRDPG